MLKVISAAEAPSGDVVIPRARAGSVASARVPWRGPAAAVRPPAAGLLGPELDVDVMMLVE